MKTGNSPSYLVKNPYSFCFRMKIPKELQGIVCKKELRYSLGTGILSDAKTKARYLAGQFQLLFRYIQHMSLTAEQIRKLLKEYKDKLFEQYDEPPVFDPQNPISRETEFQWTEAYRDCLLDALASGNYTAEIVPNWNGGFSTISQKAAKILNEKKFSDVKKTSSEHRELCQGLVQVEIQGIDHYQSKLHGKFTENHDMHSSGNLLTSATSAPTDNSPLLSEFMEEFPKTRPKWGKASHSAYKTATKVILKILGDIPVGTITRSMLVKYRETLAESPAYWTNRHKNVRAEDLPMKGIPTIDSGTFDKNLIYLKELMDLAVDREYLKDSPMPKTQMSLPKKNKEVHQFDDDQVKIILASSKDFDDHCYWIPLLGLYTGCRVNELCQLHKEDLKEKDGIWYLDINDDGKKSLKNKASKRLVPLHSALIDMGFINYVKTVTHHRIFPDCTYRPETGKYNNNFGQWFNRMLVKAGIKEKGDRSITFHSFRHRAYTTLKRLGINNEHIDLIIGHKLSESKNPEYHHGYLLADLKADIDQIPDHRTL